MIKTKDRSKKWDEHTHTHTNPKQRNERTVNRRNKKIKRWKIQKVGQKKDEENEKKNAKIKIYE